MENKWLTKEELKNVYKRAGAFVPASKKEEHWDCANKVLSMFDVLPDVNTVRLYHIIDFPSPQKKISVFVLPDTPSDIKIDIISFTVFPSRNGREWKVQI